MMRVPGAHGSPLEHKARGLDVRIVYSPPDALKLARANPDRHVDVLRDRVRDHRALHRADADARQGGGHRELLGLLQPRHHHSRPSARSSTRPTCGSTASSARATSPPSSAAARTSGSPRDEGKPIVVSGFEPLDMLQSIVMLLRQMKEGRAEVENQYKRVVPWEGNRAALRRHGRGVRAPALLRVARARLHLAVGAAHPRRVRRVGRGARLQRAGRAGDRSQGRAVRRGAQGRAQARPVQAVRQASARRSTRSAR